MEKKGLSRGWIIFIIILALVLILVFGIIGMYNNFVTLNQNVDSKWSQVENQYQVQADKIPNIVSAVSSAVSVETKFVKDVIDARTNFQNAQSQLAKDQAGVQMNNGISALVSAVAENYPTLQANKQYTQLIDELAGTQNRIGVERGRYIEAIQSFNTAVMRFPGSVFAGMFGFSQKDYYHAELSAMKTPVLGAGVLPS